MSEAIDILNMHEQIMDDYKLFVNSFINIKNETIKNAVEKEMDEGKFWPEPLIQFNPSFEQGEDINSLCDTGIIHPDMKKIFKGYNLFRHQVEAIQLGVNGDDFVVTSGTGSGKSLTFLGTIFDYLLKTKAGKGIKAVIVYPMNALINSQFEEISKYKKNYKEESGKEFPITFAQYTGQENETDREYVRSEHPDIILTNYMMLELILTRSKEDTICHSMFENIKYLVFDELHTYKGRQGADVAMLIRRIKAQASQKVNCIGTSATMVSGGTISDQKKQVADVASKIFGTPFSEEQIINEYLIRCFNFNGTIPDQKTLSAALKKEIDINNDENDLKKDSLSVWIENIIALSQKGEYLVRNRPMPFSEIISELKKDSGINEDICEKQLKGYLNWISNVNSNLENKRYTYLPYKIHQFISQTGSVFVSLNDDDKRFITLDPTHHKMDGDSKIPLYPVVFSRISGHEFICVSLDDKNMLIKAREFREFIDDEDNTKAGYIIQGEDIWDPETDLEQLPEAWLQFDKSGKCKPIKKYKNRLPRKIYFNKQGDFSYSGTYEYEGWFMPSKLLFDPTSGAQYLPGTNESTILTRLGSEARSTSTTSITYSVLDKLALFNFKEQDQKLLSFTDNRQDAALQSGHFNDSIRVIQLRSAICDALNKNEELDFSKIDQAVFESLGISHKDFADNAATKFAGVIRDNENAFKDYLMYRLLYDLRHGWRVVLPNLEQCALLKINYKYLVENCSDDTNWADIPLLEILSVDERIEVVSQLLDYFRKSYALYSNEYLTQKAITEKGKNIRERLKEPWKFGDKEEIPDPCRIVYEPLKKGSRIFTQSAGPNSALGKYLKNEAKNRGLSLRKKDEYNDAIQKILDILTDAGWLKKTERKNKKNEPTYLYQLRIDQILWKKGDEKTIPQDKIKIRSYKEYKQTPNRFYQKLYKTDFTQKKELIGHEHTGQLNNADRIEREENFRKGIYSVLFCSPTMELGIDIANLNVVHMRNVPPNPANYAQRSGRSGRSGQAALVFTNCSAYSPHDRHYFDHATDMVSGVVSPPRIDLLNKDLLISHLHAVYLSTIKLHELNTSLLDLVDQDIPNDLPLKKTVKEYLFIDSATKTKIKTIFNKVLSYINKPKTESHPWLNDEWIDIQINASQHEFDRAIDRWRRLYISIQKQLADAHRIKESGLYHINSEEMKEANRKAAQAIRQRQLLANDLTYGSVSEFYPYRYFASEGFLPGYNFTRLPLRTFIPYGDSGDYLSRPRFIALREYGPKNVIYHKGSKYQVDQLLAPEADLKLKNVKISKNCGYLMMDEEYSLDTCPFSNVPLSVASSKIFYTDLLEMSETKTREMTRISCEEEERLSKGFDIKTYFSLPAGGVNSIKKAIVKNDNEAFLKIQFLPSANLIQINTKWRTSKENGFLMGINSGRWKKESQINGDRPPSSEEIKRVQLYTHDTADALYIEPIKSLALESSGTITLQYAIKRAIENVFQVESNEIGVELMGDDEHPNIFLFEASEGSLGVLSQFVEDKDIFLKVIKEAWSVCRFDEEEYREEASYNDLLSYYNQRYHDVINRFDIKDALEKLKVCTCEIMTNTLYEDYEKQYRDLISRIDKNSGTEEKFLDYLYENGLRLPDDAQKSVEGIYCKPDFFYNPDVWVFCDGTPHDDPDVKAKDKKQRKAIKNRGDQVIEYYYKDKLQDVIERRPDIFIKVK